MEVQPIDIIHNGYQITSNKALMHVEQVHDWLTNYSYWAKGIPFEIVQTSFFNSFTVGVLNAGRQVGYARLITDYSVFSYLADVYVKEEHRGKGLSKVMMQAIMDQEWVKNCRVVMLATKDAHGLYSQYGFAELHKPERFMGRVNEKGYVALNR